MLRWLERRLQWAERTAAERRKVIASAVTIAAAALGSYMTELRDLTVQSALIDLAMMLLSGAGVERTPNRPMRTEREP